MIRKAITALLARTAVFAVLAISALAQAQSSWGQQAGLTNPGFEAPRVEEGTFVLADVLLEIMPGWKTTDTHFEIWGTGFKGVPAHEGTQFVELNAYIDGTLYQDSTGIQQGSVLEFTFAHRGRNGDDTMKLTITDLGADNSLGGGDDTVLFTKEYTTGKDAWAVYESTNEQKIEALGNTVRFGYGAVSTATGELGEGNLLDAANFGIGVVTAPPIPADGTEKNSLGMEFKLIPADTFIMGSPDCEEGRDDDEQQHVATITRDYYMGVTEVTQSQWQQVMGTTPWKGQDGVMEGDEIAASYISWNDAAKFCERLSTLEGRTYRLPTEAEWECACRAGSTTKYSFGKDESQLEQYAWYWDSEPTHPSQVKQKSPNGFGLYDMHGNVYELCQDWYGAYPQGNVTDPTGPSNGTERIIRGGGFAAKAPRVRSAMRLTVKDLALGENHLGLRVVMVPEADSGESVEMVTAGDAETTTGDDPEHILTRDLENQKGAHWSKQKIDFNEDFRISAEIYLGTKDNGADGLALVFQAEGNHLVSDGGGLGYQGISPSIVIEFDTYHNGDKTPRQAVNVNNNDPVEDHVGLRTDGDPAHTASDYVVVGNLEDGEYHPITFEWNAGQQTFNLSLDGQQIFKERSIPENGLAGQQVYFGFTAATGGLSNEHKVRSISFSK